MATWGKLILFGDSLIQQSFQPGGFGAILADFLQRKADVFNRGFSGYQTDNAVDILKDVFPEGSLEATDAVAVFFGANDAQLPGFSQHVPLEKYESNLRKIINHLTELGLPASRILLISPSAVDSEAWLAHVIAEGKGTEIDRDNEVTRKYAEACVRVASDLSCPSVNVWENFMLEKNYKKLLSDGLHFSKEGNQLVAELIMPHIVKITQNWKARYPDWKTFYV